ncbi:hypothetical protein [Mycobacterium basiliense]|nr:hypothetical protein [Mycobacterium basiliense]
MDNDQSSSTPSRSPVPPDERAALPDGRGDTGFLKRIGKWWRGERRAFLAAHFAVHIASGEWMLKGRVNGGTVIFFRSVQVALTAWLVAVWFRSFCYAAWPLRFDGVQFLRDMGNHLPWLGATFGAIYVALYTRFSAQWNYLAATYNQLMSTQAQIEGLAPTLDQSQPDRNKKIVVWKAGFIEDAQDLHLATKPTFAMAILYMLKNQDIADVFDAGAKGGEQRRKKLEALLIKSIGEDNLPAHYIQYQEGSLDTPTSTRPG